MIGIVKDKTSQLPDLAREALQILLDQLDAVGQQIGDIERHIHAEHRSNDASQRLETIPGIGVIGATAIAATVPDPTVFKSGREFAAWIGLVPRQNSSGGKERLGSISKQGRPLSAPAARRRRDSGHPARAHTSRQASLADAAAGAATGQGGCGGACQQDGADRLGGIGERRDLSSAGACGKAKWAADEAVEIASTGAFQLRG